MLKCEMAQSAAGVNNSRRHGRLDQDSGSIHSSRITDTAEWEANEALRQRELEEAKGRAAQMEKTMRWWSDCTANWREKWSKVRNERNKARDECKQLRSKLEAISKDTGTLQKERDDLYAGNEKLKQDIERMHLVLLKHSEQFSESQIANALGEGQDTPIPMNKCSSNGGDANCDVLNQKVNMLQLRLDETTKTLQLEREEKSHLNRTIGKLKDDVQKAQQSCQDLRTVQLQQAKHILELEDRHENEMHLLQSDYQNEIICRESMEKRLADLRSELERLQAENAAEWGKRERLETEKLALERDNKKIRAELRDMQERDERRTGQRSNSSNLETEIRHLQQELSDKNKEITELRHSNNKLKKLAQDEITELAHAVRRGDQYESEVKKLRVRIEELKRELAVSEDEHDIAQNALKKLQRNNEELQEQIDNLQVQLQHLHTSLDKEDGGEEMAEFQDDNDVDVNGVGDGDEEDEENSDDGGERGDIDVEKHRSGHRETENTSYVT